MTFDASPGGNDLSVYNGRMAYARIAVNVSNQAGEFDYGIPPGLESRLGIGSLVSVPFGKQTVQGVVLELVSVPGIAETRSIQDLLDPLPCLTPEQISLARWMADYYLSPLAAMLDLMLPTGLSQHADVSYSLGIHAAQVNEKSQPSMVSRRLITLLRENGSLRGRQIDRHFKNVDWRKSAQYLTRTGVLVSQSVLSPPTIRPKLIRTAQLAVSPMEAEAAMPGLGKTAATTTRRQAAVRALMRDPQAVNVSWIYAESGCKFSDLQELEERGLIILRETEIWRDPLAKLEDNLDLDDQPVELTAEQQAAWQPIQKAFQEVSRNSSRNQPAAFLLQGVTGSGKTELYMRAAHATILRGGSVILLVPEIALTPQTVRRVLMRFPGQVGLIHSRLSPGERYDTWRRARLGMLKLIIGPRSALFAPLPNVGLIVVDECHDGSYYQSEPPFYNAVLAAQEYAQRCGAVCILGSATPTIVQQYQASRPGKASSLHLVLPRRIINPEMPPVTVVDMRSELKNGNRGIFSQPMIDALGTTLGRGEQAILFLNRRGTATYVFCRECGYVAKCPQCDTPLTLHMDTQKPSAGKDSESLTCHRCNYHRHMLKTCPICKGDQVRAFGLGSEKVEMEVQRLFPTSRTLRWDWETTRQKDSHEIIMNHFSAHRADVLVGTQMLAKGLDLPLVTLVGIVLADVGLTLPDPFATERSFNLLTQVSGRAGRSKLGGRVILQTFLPDHYVIQAASRHDVDAFYSRELDERMRLGYPPYTRLIRLEYRHFEIEKVEAEARRISSLLQDRITSGRFNQTNLIGPAPCFFSRLAGLHRWQLILRGPQPEVLVRELKLNNWRIEVDPVSLL